MKSTLLASAMLAAVISGPAFAASTTMTTAPANAVSVTMYYKQTVYDPKENKIGAIDDVLLDQSGKVEGLVVGVGGFLGMGEKDVIVPFDAVKVMHKTGNGAANTTTATGTTANSNNWLAMDETKDSLKAAPGFSYDRTTMTWKLAK